MFDTQLTWSWVAATLRHYDWYLACAYHDIGVKKPWPTQVLLEKVMKILVTGGAGYIGTSVIARLINMPGFEIGVLDTLDFGINPLSPFIKENNFELIVGDVCDEHLVKNLLVKYDGVIHLAALVGYPACDGDPARAVALNVDATRSLCRMVSNSQRLVFASTGSAYGKVEGVCTEETPINPLTLYGRTKAEAEKFVEDAGGVSLRLATLFGLSLRMRDDLLINNFVKIAVRNGELDVFEGHARRTFLHVSDAAKGFVDAVKGKFGVGFKANVGSASMNFSKLEVAQMVSEATGARLTDGDGTDPDMRDYEVDYSKITKLGFEADISIEEGIKELAGHYEGE